MSSSNARNLGRGPFTADMIEPGSRYELSGGHPVLCMPTAPRGGRANLLGGAVLETDPAVTEAGVDVGYSSEDTQLRAPDVGSATCPTKPAGPRACRSSPSSTPTAARTWRSSRPRLTSS
ncbi:MAG: hypothetical protein HY791_21800 [Deltaproteobacteria bacterium]|nr:hypothetical protein [Deltaproteobacteria bacterium]